MVRPTLAEHETRISLLEQGREHDAERNAIVLRTLQEIRDEMKTFREHVDAKFDALTERQNKAELHIDTIIAEAKGTVQGIKVGWAAAFTLIGGGIVAAFNQLVEFFK
jgi:hypothetical protein